MKQLELNQSLISQWLGLNRNQTDQKLKKLNATHEETRQGFRSLQADMNRTSSSLADLITRLGLDIDRGDLQMQMHTYEASTRTQLTAFATDVAELRRGLEASEHRESLLRQQIDDMRVGHRVELIACVCLSLVLSTLLAMQSVTRHQRHAAAAERADPTPPQHSSPPLAPPLPATICTSMANRSEHEPGRSSSVDSPLLKAIWHLGTNSTEGEVARGAPSTASSTDASPHAIRAPNGHQQPRAAPGTPPKHVAVCNGAAHPDLVPPATQRNGRTTQHNGRAAEPGAASPYSDGERTPSTPPAGHSPTAASTSTWKSAPKAKVRHSASSSRR